MSESMVTVQPTALVQDIATAAAVESARAQIESRIAIAHRFRRNWDDALMQLCDALKRPAFVSGQPGMIARYSLRFGQKTTSGWSIRFAEEAVRCSRNMAIEDDVTFENEAERHVRVTVLDLESNISFSATEVVPKRLERSAGALAGRRPISSRQNSRGEPTYLVEANDGELHQLHGVARSKAMRNAALRMIPGWVLEQCAQQHEATERADVHSDPDAARLKLVQAFHGLGIEASEIARAIGHPLDALTEDEIHELKSVFAAVRDRDLTWQEWAATRGPTDDRAAVERATAVQTALREAERKRKARRVTAKAGAAPAHDPATGEVAGAPSAPGREPGEEG